MKSFKQHLKESSNNNPMDIYQDLVDRMITQPGYQGYEIQGDSIVFSFDTDGNADVAYTNIDAEELDYDDIELDDEDHDEQDFIDSDDDDDDYVDMDDTYSSVSESKEYDEFFKKALDKFGVDSPEDLEGKKKKEFFDYVDKNWKADNELPESITESVYLQEAKLIVKVNSKGKKRRRVKCRRGHKLNSKGTACVPIAGKEKASKRVSIRKAVRTKKAKGSGFQNRVNRRRAKAVKKRKSMGL